MLDTDYSLSKLQLEREVEDLCTQMKIEFAILRMTGVMGPGDLFVIFELIQMVLQNIIKD